MFATIWEDKVASAFKKPCVSIKNISRVGISSGEASTDQHDFPVKFSMGEKIIHHDENIMAFVPEVLSKRHCRIRCKVNYAGRVFRTRRDNNSIIFNTGFMEKRFDFFDIGFFLTYA